MGIIDIGGTGSPLIARQNKLVYLVLLVAAVVIGLFALVYLFLKLIKKVQESEAWQEAHKKKPTKYSHVVKLAKQMNLTIEDENLLWDACRHTKAPNILYLIKDMVAVDNLLRSEYHYLLNEKKSEKDIYALFALRAKIANIHAANSRIKTTGALQDGQIIYITRSTSSNMKQPIQVIDNVKNGLFLLLPSNMQTQGSRPVELSKVHFSIPAPSGGLYTFFTRVVRYTTMKDGRPAMIVAQTNDVSFQERRKQKRLDIEIPCTFTVVGANAQEQPAKIKDISSGGVKIQSTKPLKEGQPLSIKFPIHGNMCEVAGDIVRTTRNNEGDTYYLAIKFTRITAKIRNDILALVYNWS